MGKFSLICCEPMLEVIWDFFFFFYQNALVIQLLEVITVKRWWWWWLLLLHVHKCVCVHVCTDQCCLKVLLHRELMNGSHKLLQHRSLSFVFPLSQPSCVIAFLLHTSHFHSFWSVIYSFSLFYFYQFLSCIFNTYTSQNYFTDWNNLQ